MGEICTILFNDNITELALDEVDTLLSGICEGLENYGQHTRTAVISLGYSINFLKNKLNEEEVADFIFNTLVKILEKATELKDVEVITPTLSCIEELARVIYPNFRKYSNIIFDRVLKCLVSNDNKLILTFHEFFITLLEEEKK